MMNNLCIVIPAYNEEKRIGKTLEFYSTFFNKIRNKNFDYNLIIVINNTKDRTEEIVKLFSKKNKRIKYINLIQGGKGNAITEGFKLALKGNYSLIGFVDADLATSPEQFYRLVNGISGYDAAIANRYNKDSRIIPVTSFRRTIVSRVFNFIVRLLFFFPYQDTQCGAKLFKKEALARIINDLKITAWAYDVNLLYSSRIHGLRVAEVSTVWNEIRDSHINIGKNSIQMVLAVLQLRVINSPFRRVLRPLKVIIGPIWRAVR